jgi:hypothetical protein
MSFALTKLPRLAQNLVPMPQAQAGSQFFAEGLSWESLANKNNQQQNKLGKIKAACNIRLNCVTLQVLMRNYLIMMLRHRLTGS